MNAQTKAGDFQSARNRFRMTHHQRLTLCDGWQILAVHAGRRTSGSPGAVTIRRGLDIITPIAIALEVLDSEANCDKCLDESA